VISGDALLDALIQRGYDCWSGVPCSFLTAPLLRMTARSEIDWINAANEGDALAVCTGAVLGGRKAVAFMQNSGLGNAVSPLTSLNWPFRIPVLLLVTARGWPGEHDEPQHALMGAVTGPLLDTLQIPWEQLPKDLAEIEQALARAEAWMQKHRTPFAFVVSRNTFEPVQREPAGRVEDPRAVEPRPHVDRSASPLAPDTELCSRRAALEHLVRRTPVESSLVVSSTGYTSRELYAIEDRPNQFYMVGSMGCTAALGLGLALARPSSHVVVVEGDGSALMRLQNFAMVGSRPELRFSHLVLDNCAHESTGGQPTLSSGVDLAEVASACGYSAVRTGTELSLIDWLLDPQGPEGPRLARLRVRPGVEGALPRPTIAPHEVAERLTKHAIAQYETRCAS